MRYSTLADAHQARRLAGATAIVIAALAAGALTAAFLLAWPLGPLLLGAGAALGWGYARLTQRPDLAAAPPSPLPAVTQEPPVDRATLSALRHDLRGILSAAMLVSDRLLTHEDPAVQRAGATIVKTVERATARLSDPEKPPAG